MTTTWSTIPPADADAVAGELSATLVELVDLHLQGKQAHWTVVGERFKVVHEQLDELVVAWRGWADRVAERAVTLGAVPDGQAGAVKARSDLPPLDVSWLGDGEVVEQIGRRVEEVARRVRDRHQAVADRDPVTESILLEVLEGLEEQLWMLRAQAVPTGGGSGK